MKNEKEFYLPRKLSDQFLDTVSSRNEVIFTFFIFTRGKFQKSKEKMKN